MEMRRVLEAHNRAALGLDLSYHLPAALERQRRDAPGYFCKIGR
jgi:hypothetical protein